MIEQKKAYLRGEVKADPISTATSSNQQGSQYTQKLYAEFNQLSSTKDRNENQNKRVKELKELLKIIDSFQWGENKNLTKIGKELSSKINFRIEDHQVTKAFKELMKREVLIGKSDKVL